MLLRYRVSRGGGVWLTAAGVAVLTSGASGALLNEDFATDPLGAASPRAQVAGDTTRFSYSGQKLIAAYDTARATTKLLWSLGKTLTAGNDFRYEVDFSITGQGFSADPNGFAQIAFGLVNSSTTGGNRSGGPTFDGANGSAYDTVTADYFPNLSSFGGPTLGATVIQTQGQAPGFFSSIEFPFGDETDLTTEGPLPLDTKLAVRVVYQAATRTLTLELSGVDINSKGGGNVLGGADGDIHTIQNVLPSDVVFSVDSFGILLWQDEFISPGGGSSVVADVAFERIVVVPEPAGAGVLVVLMTAAWRLTRRAQAS